MTRTIALLPLFLLACAKEPRDTRADAISAETGAPDPADDEITGVDDHRDDDGDDQGDGGDGGDDHGDGGGDEARADPDDGDDVPAADPAIFGVVSVHSTTDCPDDLAPIAAVQLLELTLEEQAGSVQVRLDYVVVSIPSFIDFSCVRAGSDGLECEPEPMSLVDAIESLHAELDASETTLTGTYTLALEVSWADDCSFTHDFEAVRL